MQIVGLCRFSYPCLSGGFQIEHESFEERVQYLYEEKRLAERLFTLEHITLPGIRDQTDKDFVFAILIGTSLPEHITEKILSLTEDIPHVVVLAFEPMQYRQAMAQVFEQVLDKSHNWSIQFRLDDDDAVSVDFIKRLRRNANMVAPIYRETGKMAIDFNQGFVFELTKNGLKTARVQRPYWTPAFAIAISKALKKNVMNFPHHIAFKNMPTITRHDSDMYLRGISNHNDSHFSRGLPERLELDDETRAILETRFSIDVDKLEAELEMLEA